jgi:ERCC4-type nuclease
VIPSFKELQVVTENLPLGDAIISNGVEEKIIIERKSRY